MGNSEKKFDSTWTVLVLFEKSYKCRATLANRPDVAPTDSLHFQTRQNDLASLRNVTQNHQTSYITPEITLSDLCSVINVTPSS